MTSLAQLIRQSCEAWCQAFGRYETTVFIGRDGFTVVGQWYQVGPWHIVVARKEDESNMAGTVGNVGQQ